ncbi:MAG: VOC family protein [Bacteroidia bacterium]|nr:VOC family protein [Bacteroidia bacterium]
MANKKGRITGLGGIFFKAKDPKATKQWYDEHFSLGTDQYGKSFQWYDLNDKEKICHTQWSAMKDDTDYFDPGKQDYMINYRVENLEELIEELKTKGVKQVGGLDKYDYGKFAWVLDPDGNKIELWEPVDQVFTDMEEEKKKAEK